MVKIKELESIKIKNLEKQYPFILSFFQDNKLDVEEYEEYTLKEYLNHFTEEEIEEWAIDVEKIKLDLESYINQMIEFLGLEKDTVDSISIIAGKDKHGNKENFEELTINKSEIVSIVGPTGAGKSRLLADIEWAANKDTPTERVILVNGKIPDKSLRFSTSNKLVAQLSQNMNFIMDLTVREFLELHAKSRMIDNEEEVIKKIIEAANELAGEKFDLDTQVTGLSGGQSRALMIADTAILSTSPIVLIDEIENAGIDRKRALNLLVNEEKIVLMATHDPSLTLMADKRIVIKNGGIHKVIDTGAEEKGILKELEKMDDIINTMRANLRKGEVLKNK
ncbi:ATP-binding cassette domain-containing protein [Clostridium sp. D2Q-14]|uniref:ATP-binding cassette domain-containing protein n=1 Tax=Anaeromonas gelatinilytica TaxID=2683194 RepID=UPI00193C235A|nr:ATP-binding cassette domain-containing protein [Anaeromonas gelatinilytica]MBS4535089.1 ATP-binding cassette domain-containing protein [Anaeromonas gelatinilytica]